ncbi:uncharacterized protein Z520_09785 [Fonsecaea multimorphosa CBS 102226]|uniref:Uncharacterized protein n=1 Tax=Fonsecaea multimorphosa CBS 102226 TaxID=1442371 RepID=A0A0D2JV49_9EURO|nr:uncharacterized protein Z520_09785 [Fonsecaea multimorphosa CBS 102226]KIX94399.1 hypothetical protein Z520_09785 [Fonsecaea multimorphosa CBS 102226]OAL20159.1 hypothetical protein AYO22_09131 [Fonsecaea multimorphosa]
MSFVDLLFPQKELEALGNKWHEPAPKRRRLDAGSFGNVQVKRESLGGQRKQCSEPTLEQRRHRLSTPAPIQYGRPSASFERMNVRGTKRSNSESQPVSCTPNMQKQTTKTKSCVPSFIEPSIMRNYLQHLHPKDRHRYTAVNEPKPGSKPRESNLRMSPPSLIEDSPPSPASLIADTSSSPASSDSCPTPAAVCEQFRSGPFGHIFDGMRLTDNERDLMEDLLNPSTTLAEDQPHGQTLSQTGPKLELAPEDYLEIDEALLQNIFHPFGKHINQPFDFAVNKSTNVDEENDVHSSGLSPAAEEVAEAVEDNPTSHRGIVVYDYNALSVDDFFDLDEASSS